MSPLVEKLSKGEHPVSLARYQGIPGIKEAIERGFILVKFTGTQGGTEIGVSLDKDDRGVDLASSTTSLRGSLTLDYQPVKCTVHINLETLTGHGFLEPVAAA
ncbi:MAG TPA: hypothetical protein VI653_27885 [Steroidobacteraceae bacterium]